MGFGEDHCREFPGSLLSPLETTHINSTDKSAPSKAKGWEKGDQTTEDFSAHSYPTLGTHQQKCVPHPWFQQTEGELASHSPSTCRSSGEAGGTAAALLGGGGPLLHLLCYGVVPPLAGYSSVQDSMAGARLGVAPWAVVLTTQWVVHS